MSGCDYRLLDRSGDVIAPGPNEPDLWECQSCKTVVTNRGIHDRYHSLGLI